MFDEMGESSTRIHWDETLEVGDKVTWWADSHMRGLPPGHPDARQREGVIDHVYAPLHPCTVVAYGVTCNGLSGPYQLTLRPDYRHEPRRQSDVESLPWQPHPAEQENSCRPSSE